MTANSHEADHETSLIHETSHDMYKSHETVMRLLHIKSIQGGVESQDALSL